MKILKVKFQNLASISGITEIDFEGPVLKSAPVFAITGRTGAGKSTILDAICLALYGSTPRYPPSREAASKVNEILSRDERHILRRGAGEGFAEVEFVGRNHKKYCARWSVQRARKKADGSLQGAKRQLTDIALNKIFERVDEISSELEMCLGLDFHQFRHAVMLAQGEFRAFLDEKEDKRSELLEKITGTGIYTDLSIEAYRRKSLAEKELEQISSSIGDINILSDEDRKTLEERIRELNKKITDFDINISNSQKAIDWHDIEKNILDNLANLQEKSNSVAAQEEQFKDDFIRLAEIDKLGSARTNWDNLKSCKNKVKSHEQELLVKIQERQNHIENREKLSEENQKAELNLRNIRNETEMAKPELDRARKLDTQIADKKIQLENISRDIDSSESSKQSEIKRLEEIRKKQTSLLTEKEAVQDWLKEHEPFFPILDSVGQYLKKIQTLENSGKTLLNISNELNKLKESSAKASQELEEGNRKIQSLQIKIVESKSQRDMLQGELKNLNVSKIKNEEQTLQDSEKRFLKAQEEYKNLANEEMEFARLEAEIIENSPKSSELESNLKAIEKEIDQIETEKAKLEEKKERFKSALNADLDSIRMQLEENKPCPVCGSLEHPYVMENVIKTMAEELAEIETGIKESASRLKKLRKIEINDHTQISALKEKIALSSEQKKKLGESIKNREKQICEYLMESFSVEKLAETLVNLQDRLKFLRSEFQKAEKIQKDINKFQKNIDDLSQNIEEFQKKIKQVQTQKETLNPEISRLEGEHFSKTEAQKNLCEDLREAFCSRIEWVTAINSQKKLTHLADQLASEAENRLKFKHRFELLGKEIQQLERDEAARSGQLQEIEKILADATIKNGLVKNEMSSLLYNRKAIFQGKNVSEIEKAFSEKMLVCEKACKEIQDRLNSVKQTISALDGQLDSLSKSLEYENNVVTRESDSLERISKTHNISLSRIDELFSLPHDKVNAIREKQKQISESRKLLEGQKKAGNERLEKHLESKRPELSRDKLTENIVLFQNSRQALQDEKSTLDGKIAVDNDSHLKKKDRTEELERLSKKAEVWIKLAQSIGSADGKVFRKFAQRITLQHLLSHANLHLEKLRPRYSLKYNQQSDMDFFLVDRDLCDEIRPIKSLSGGESFLVSLSLALALSNMAAKDMSIDSLFIDEGFGTLDSDSLNMAISVLQSLHQKGKQVGVISHVDGIAQNLGAEIHVETIGPGESRVQIRKAM
ncbi:MAG: AAA family ATPase [Candidatus Riflebacteria bacterium]|nr:AAA family ATPase [Candidatus Riflebacteria bacterium]